MEIPCFEELIVKTKETPEIKSVNEYDKRLQILEDAYTIKSTTVKGKNVLLIDDLFRSGATLNAITDVLYSRGEAASVYALALTRTRSMR